MFKKLITWILWIVCISWVCFAHQPRFPEWNQTLVPDPEISKAYYAKLSWDTQEYQIISNTWFDLYVNILVPANTNQKKDVSVMIFQNEDRNKPFATLDWVNFQRTRFFEEFGRDTYRKWPEFSGKVSSWIYDIVVMSTTNDSKYSLAIGQIEKFDFREWLNALRLIPRIKRDFFDESPIGFILSPMWWGIIIMMYVMSFIIWFLYRLLLKLLPKRQWEIRIHKNIWSKDRWMRAFIGLGLLLRAITTDRSLRLLFFSGFCFFEAIFSRCWFYAAIGKSSCPIE